MRLAIVASHPIQYYAPLFRTLASRADLHVFFAHRATPADQAKAGFGVEFDWDTDLCAGYRHHFMQNVAAPAGLDRFAGCDTPELYHHLKRDNYDAVLVMGWHLKAFIQAIIAAKCARLPVMVRGDSQIQTPRSGVKKLAKGVVYPGFLRLFDAALYVGQRSREYWEHYHYPKSRLFFSPHCIDTRRFASGATAEARANLRSRLGIRPEERVALFAGKLLPFKRPLDLVKAVARLKDSGLTVTILLAGSGPLEADVIGAARSAGVPLHLLGFCNQTEMPAVYSAADFLVLPSDARETWGLVANEAVACGKPVILSDAVGAARDLAWDREAGRVFPIGNIDELAECMIDVVRQPPSLEQLAAKSAAYSIDNAASGIICASHFAIDRGRKHSQRALLG